MDFSSWEPTNTYSYFRHVETLEARIKELEHERASSHASPADYNSSGLPQAEQPQPNLETTSHTSTTFISSNVAQNSMVGQSNITVHQTPKSSPRSPSQQSKKRYGKSPALHFALAVKASATAMNGEHESVHDEERGSPVTGSPGPANETHNAISYTGEVEETDDEGDSEPVHNVGRTQMSQLLPYRQLAKRLFDRYFEVIHPIWPLLLENETRELFSRTWTSDDPPEPMWLVQLNLIMCLACFYCEPADKAHLPSGFDAKASGEEFFRRAQDYVYANAFTMIRIGMIQALLLIAQYQQIVMRFEESYLAIGHASRMAQSVGLHISRPESDSLLPQHQELRRRLWWACFCFDR